ncbi:MAG: sulfotransferase [Thermoleophilia bacterium]
MGSGYQRRDDPSLAPEFAKDAAQEDFLERLNLVLAPHAEADAVERPERLPTLHVVGSPRSGTTLMYQVIATGLDVGYINNLMAAFWLAPGYGVSLARKLGVDRLSSGFQSAFGRTEGITEPHEFGYFWNHHLRYPDMRQRGAAHEEGIDWARLRRTLVDMAERAGAPMTFKPMLLAWHLDAMVRHMPRTCIVWIRRPQRETAVSLLKMRRSMFGGFERWASLRPDVDLDHEPPWRQTAAQVVLVERTIAASCARLGPGHVLPVRYERLCEDPMGVLADVRELMGRHGHAPDLRVTEMAPFTEGRNDPLDAEYGDRIDVALAEFRERWPE